MVYSFIQDEARNDEVSVGTSSTLLAFSRTEANPRKVFLIRNTSAAAIISVNLGLSKAVLGKGIVLRPNESFYDSSEAGYRCFQGTINAIANVAGGTIAIMER